MLIAPAWMSIICCSGLCFRQSKEFMLAGLRHLGRYNQRSMGANATIPALYGFQILARSGRYKCKQPKLSGKKPRADIVEITGKLPSLPRELNLFRQILPAIPIRAERQFCSWAAGRVASFIGQRFKAGTGLEKLLLLLRFDLAGANLLLPDA